MIVTWARKLKDFREVNASEARDLATRTQRRGEGEVRER